MNVTKVTRARRAITELRRLTRQLEPQVANIVRRSIRDLRRRLPEAKIARAFEERGVEGVLALMQPELDRFADDIAGRTGGQGLKALLLSVYQEGSRAGRAMVPRNIEARIRFDLTNPKALSFIDRFDFGLIREITNETRDVIRGIVLDAFQSGMPPKAQARLIREHIGLTQAQSRAVRNFRDQLTERTNAPGGRSMRAAGSRRLSASERALAARQIRDGNLTSRQIDKLVETYRTRLVNLRANTIGRAETIRASTQGQLDLWREAREQGLLSEQETRKRWVVTNDERLCPICAPIPGLNKDGIPIDGTFKTPAGPLEGPPAHPSCRCSVTLMFVDQNRRAA